MEVSGQFPLRPLARFSPGIKPRDLLNRKCGESKNLSERFWEEKNVLPLPVFELRFVQPVV
jgi:hypothetical protein